MRWKVSASIHLKWINEEGKIVYIKYHWKPQQGVRNLNAKEVQEVQGKDFNHATRDLFDAIEKGNHPKWDFTYKLCN